MKLSEYREDPRKQSEGTPIHAGSSTFFVKRWGTPASLKARKDIKLRLFGPLHKHSEDDDALLLAHWLAEYGVTGWVDVFGEDGKEIKYSKDIARDIFLDEGMELSLNVLLFEGAMAFENYLFDDAEETIEELKKS